MDRRDGTAAAQQQQQESREDTMEEEEEEEEEEMPVLVEVPFDSAKVVPVTILTGFLGSGKTTLLNYILTANHGKRIAVVENEFSQGLGIEGMIAKSGVNGDNITNFIELNNGCICCTVKDDLLRALEQLVLHKDRFDYVLIETTGLANPGPVITSFWSDPSLHSALFLDGVICVVDCFHFLSHLSSPSIAHEVRQQIGYADRLLLNKIDLVPSAEKVRHVLQQVQEINPLAAVQTTTFGHVDLSFLLHLGSYAETGASCLPCALPEPVHSFSSSTSSVRSVAMQWGPAARCRDVQKLKRLLDFLLYAREQGEAAGPLSPAFLQDFPPLATRRVSPSMTVYRMKGLLHVQEEEEEEGGRLFLLQAVHHLFEVEAMGGSQDRTQGRTSLVVIGLDLDDALLRALFDCCIA